MATSAIKMTFGFTDDTKRSLTIDPFAEMDATAIAGVKNNIKAFNASDTATIASLILSDDGASCTGIVEASVINVNETEINLND